MGSVEPYNCQDTWFKLVEELGEEGARKELARLLRLAADTVERGGYPDVLGCELPLGRKICQGEFLSTVSVTLSLPWPG